jgi:hypothetical protein
LIALVNLLEDDCSVATVFFAMAYLLDFFMYCHTLEDGVEFFQLHAVWRILFILGCVIP